MFRSLRYTQRTFSMNSECTKGDMPFKGQLKAIPQNHPKSQIKFEKRLMIVWSWERENELLMPGRKGRQKEVKCLLSSWETASLCHYCLCLFSLNLLFSLVKLYIAKLQVLLLWIFSWSWPAGKWIWKFLLGWRLVGRKAVLRFSLMAALKLDIFDGSHQAWYGFMRPRIASISTLLHNPRNLTTALWAFPVYTAARPVWSSFAT